MENQQKPDDVVRQDEDVQFERDKESLITSLTSEENDQSNKDPLEENPVPAKEDTMGNSDFPPLSELDKQPKIHDDEDRMNEIKPENKPG
ncbi:MAG: hypothetical protein WKF89_06530 [Chitinophagaceae bacterium]